MKFFQDLKRPCKGNIGNKAANLKRSFEAGFSIPPTAVLSLETANALAREGRLLPAPLPALLAEAEAMFSPVMPVIIRSSAREEDSENAGFAGIFDSVEVYSIDSFMKGLERVLASHTGQRARAYRKARGLPEPAASSMAVMVQPLLKADFAGAALYEQNGKITVDFARYGNRAITGGGDARFSTVFDPRSRKFAEQPASKDAAVAGKLAVAAAEKAEKLLFPGKNVAVEFAVIDNQLVLLQVKSQAKASRATEIDMPALYLKLHEAMESLGLTKGQWGIAETLDFAAFNYLGRTRKDNETLEHLRIRLHGVEAQRVVARGWKQVRNSSETTLFPPVTDKKASAIITALAKDRIMLIFEPPLDDIQPCKTVTMESGGRKFDMLFSLPPEGMAGHEREYLRNRLSSDNLVWHVTRFKYELETSRDLCAALAKEKGAYARSLLKTFRRVARLSALRLKMTASPMAQRTGTVFAGKPLVRRDMALRGKALTPSAIMTAKGGGYIYTANDLEPSFITQAGKLAGVVVSRGTRNSHAAAICAELGIPLIYGARGIASIKNGELLEADFNTGRVTRLEVSK